MDTSTITITFGDVAENHARMQKLGKVAKNGFTVAELIDFQTKFTSLGCTCELVPIPYVSETGKTEDLQAAVLVIRNGVDALSNGKSKHMFTELSGLEWDRKAFMRGRVVNKHARWNLCFGNTPQDPDYINGKGRIVSYKDVPITKSVHQGLENVLGEKGKNLVAEGNYYYNVKKCYIGYHGDGERRLVIGVRLGAPFPLHFQWFFKGEKVGTPYTISLNGGDMYIMSDIAVGWNWLKKNIPTLRHSAGFAIPG